MEKKTGRIIESRKQAIFGKGTKHTNMLCWTTLKLFCQKDGRDAPPSMVLPITQEKLWPALVTVFGLAELKTDSIIVKAKE